MALNFPAGFVWGVSTAAYQVEGGVSADGRGTSIWDVFAHTPGKVWHGDTGDIACDQYHRLDADLDLLVALGIPAYRFSVAWPRILPEGGGKVNQPGLDYYQRLVDGLLSRNITPMLTLYHWDLPQALQSAGGWTNRATAEHFANYAAVVYGALGDRVPYWITLNEPRCVAFVGHLQGRHAPGWQDQAATLAVTHHLLLGHGLAVTAMRGLGGSGQFGITLDLTWDVPASAAPADVAAARQLDGIQNRLFLDPLFKSSYPADILAHYQSVSDFGFVQPGDLATIAAPLDFLGINYYETHVVRADPTNPQRSVVVPPTGALTAAGKGIAPDGLRELLLRVSQDYTATYTATSSSLPLYITESGAPFHDYINPDGNVTDTERVAYLEAHFRAAHQAIAQGVDLRGYFVWSFLDNFEWALGYAQRYGIVFVEFGSQQRIPKQSAHWYTQVIQRNGLE